MIAAGYRHTTAVQGRAMLPPALLAFLAPTVSERLGPRIQEYIEAGAKLTAQEQENFVRGRALAAGTEGSDKGAQMLKLLGSDRRCNMFVADSQVGVIIVGEMPKELESVLRSHGEDWPDEPEQVNGDLP